MEEELNDQQANHQQKKNKGSDLNLVRHTEQIDNLMVQNKELNKELHIADQEINELDHQLKEQTIKIPKPLFYAALGVIVIMAYFVNGHIIELRTQMTEMKSVLTEYKSEIQRTRDLNDMLEKQIKE